MFSQMITVIKQAGVLVAECVLEEIEIQSTVDKVYKTNVRHEICFCNLQDLRFMIDFDDIILLGIDINGGCISLAIKLEAWMTTIIRLVVTPKRIANIGEISAAERSRTLGICLLIDINIYREN